MFGIGAGEFILILIVGLIVFGPSKLPEFGRSLGKLIRELKKTQATLSNAINLDEPVNNTPSKTTSVSSSPAPTTVAVDSKVNEVSSPTTSTENVATTEQLTQLANSNPIRLDKVNSESTSSKEHLTK